MHTRFEVRAREGELLGIFPAPLAECAEQVKALIAAHPGAEVKSVVTLDDPCAAHPAYEADNCPTCGTAQDL